MVLVGGASRPVPQGEVVSLASGSVTSTMQWHGTVSLSRALCCGRHRRVALIDEQSSITDQNNTNALARHCATRLQALRARPRRAARARVARSLEQDNAITTMPWSPHEGDPSVPMAMVILRNKCDVAAYLL